MAGLSEPGFQLRKCGFASNREDAQQAPVHSGFAIAPRILADSLHYRLGSEAALPLVTSANPIPKGGEAFRGLESDGALHLAANRSGSGASEEFAFCRRKRRIVRNQ